MATMTFQEYVLTQDPNRVIEHGGWEDCAVGCYITEVLCRNPDTYYIQEIKGIVDDDLLYHCLNFCGKRLITSNGELVLTYPDNSDYNKEFWPKGRPISVDSYNSVINTFGDIQKYYRRQLSLTVDESELN